MKGKEQGTESEIMEFICWHDVAGSELNVIRRTLKNGHSQFQRLEHLTGSIQRLPITMEMYKDDMENYIGFLFPATKQGNIKVISSPASSPIVWELLDRDTAERLVF